MFFCLWSCFQQAFVLISKERIRSLTLLLRKIYCMLGQGKIYNDGLLKGV
jgi:hypothetical protein